MATYIQRDMEEAGIEINFVQDNQPMSTKGVLRGFHFQKNTPRRNRFASSEDSYLMWLWI